MPYDDEVSLSGKADRDEPHLLLRVIWIDDSSCERITENGRRFFKGYAMLLEVALGLFRIPLELHSRTVAQPLRVLKRASLTITPL
jgi:hypothetical protein